MPFPVGLGALRVHPVKRGVLESMNVRRLWGIQVEEDVSELMPEIALERIFLDARCIQQQ